MLIVILCEHFWNKENDSHLEKKVCYRKIFDKINWINEIFAKKVTKITHLAHALKSMWNIKVLKTKIEIV